MNGHGHVIPNADGIKARCGGVGLCLECQRELQELNSQRRRTPHTPAMALRLAMYDLGHQRDFAGGPSVLEAQAIEAMSMALTEIEMLKSRVQSLEEARAAYAHGAEGVGQLFGGRTI